MNLAFLPSIEPDSHPPDPHKSLSPFSPLPRRPFAQWGEHQPLVCDLAEENDCVRCSEELTVACAGPMPVQHAL